jgi:hypothetical protein
MNVDFEHMYQLWLQHHALPEDQKRNSEYSAWYYLVVHGNDELFDAFIDFFQERRAQDERPRAE